MCGGVRTAREEYYTKVLVMTCADDVYQVDNIILMIFFAVRKYAIW